MLLFLFLCVLGACARTPAVFWSDPFFELTQEDALNRQLRSIAAANGFRLRINQLPPQADYYNLIAAQMEQQQVVVLSPLLFREAVILAESFPDHSVMLLGDRVERHPTNLALVRFEREETMRALGMRIPELLDVEEQALIFFLDDGEQRRAELAALMLGWEAAEERVNLITIQPDETEANLVQQFQSSAGEQLGVLGLLLGSQQRLAGSVATMTDATLLLENIGNAAFYPGRARISIENDYPSALQALLRELSLGSGRTLLRIPARLAE